MPCSYIWQVLSSASPGRSSNFTISFYFSCEWCWSVLSKRRVKCSSATLFFILSGCSFDSLISYACPFSRIFWSVYDIVQPSSDSSSHSFCCPPNKDKCALSSDSFLSPIIVYIRSLESVLIKVFSAGFIYPSICHG